MIDRLKINDQLDAFKQDIGVLDSKVFKQDSQFEELEA